MQLVSSSTKDICYKNGEDCYVAEKEMILPIKADFVA